LHDASLYHGKYYVYFGAAPAVLLMLPFRLMTGMDLPLPAAVLGFVYLGFLVSVGIFLAIRRRYFPQAGTTLVLLGVLVLALASATPALLRRPAMWELPIGAGYCFAMLSAGCVWLSLHASQRRAWWFAGAGLWLGLAIASRPTYLFASGVLAVPVVGWWWRERRAPWRPAIAAGLPLALIGAVLAWHNYARFGNPLEFGQAYQLSFDYESKLPHFAARYVPFTFHAHFFGPAEWTRYFPFIGRGDLGVAPEGFTNHRGDIYGLLNHFPVTWLALLAPLALWRRTAVERDPFALWLGATTVLFAGMAMLMLSFFSALARYQADFVPAFLLLTVVGLLAAERWSVLALGSSGRGLVMLAVGLGVFASAAFGVLFTLQFDGLLRERNPALEQKVARLFNRLPAAVEFARGVRHGPIELTVRWVAVSAPSDETLVTIGRAPIEDRVIARHLGDGRVQLGFAAAGAVERFSPPMTLAPEMPHRIRVSIASLFPPPTHPFFAGRTPAQVRATLRRAEIAVDGVAVLQEHLRLDRAGSGEVRVGRVGSWQRVAAVENVAVGEAAPVVVGDTVRLRVRWRAQPRGTREPLVVTGRTGAGDLLMIEYLGGDEVRFALDHWGSPLRVSPPVRLASGQTHEIALALDSLRAVEDATLVRAERRGEVRVDVDGTKIWEEKLFFFTAEAAEVWIGRNGIGGTGCGAEFTGEILAAERVARE
jgi:hypothetical protein